MEIMTKAVHPNLKTKRLIRLRTYDDDNNAYVGDPKKEDSRRGESEQRINKA